MSNEIIGRGWKFPPQVDTQGGLALSSGSSELSQAIHVILSTSPGQRVMRPNFGCQLHELVFAPCNTQTIAQACRYVEQALGMWEPRINVINVDAGPDPDHPHCLLIEIQYEVKATHDRRSLVYPLYLNLEVVTELKPVTLDTVYG
jgi:Bacteriophage baseplate protein W